MAIGFGASRAWAYAASGNVTPTLATHAAGDMLIVHVAYKSSAIATCLASTATSGWNKLGEFHDGTVNSGNGTGSVAVAVFWKEAASSSETAPAVTFSQATTQVGHSALTFTKGGSETWSAPLGDGGLEDNVASTTWSMPMQSHVSSTAGDVLVAFIASRDDSAFEATATRPQVAQVGVSAYTGNSIKAPATAGLDGSGADGSYDSSYRGISTGTSSAAATISTTIAVAETGSGWVTRLRVTAGGGATASPTAAALTLSVGTPTVAAPFTGQPTVAALTLSLGTPTVSDNAYSAAVLADSPVGYWRMGEASGSVLDSVGTNHGTAAGTVTRDVTGALAAGDDGAITFGGGYVAVADHASLDLGDVVTVEAWVTSAVSGGDKGIVGKDTGAYYLRLDASTNTLRLLKANIASIVTSTTPVPGTGWHHVVATKNGATVKLYIDGADVTGTVTNATLVDNALDLYIGAADIANEKMAGSIDEAAVYGTALSAARVLAHYNAGSGAGPVTASPTTAALTLSAGTPTVVAIGTAVSLPTAAALTLSTGTPTVAAPRLSQPTAVALALSAGTPLVTAPALSQPTAAALTLSRGTPLVTAPFTGQPTAVALTLSAGTPTVAVGAIVSAQPTVAALTLSVGTPTVVAVGTALSQPTAAALTLSRGTPTVVAPALSQPTAAALTLTAGTPTVLAPRLSQPTAASLVLAVGTPTVLRPVLSQPTAVALTLSRGTPTVTAVGTASRQPTAAALTLAVGTPTVAAGGNQTATPTVAALILSAGTPSVSTGAAVSSQPTAAALTLTRGTPTVVAVGGAVSQPTAAALTLSRGTPVVTAIGTAVSLPTAAVLTLSTATPPVAAPRVSLPSVTALSLSGGTPTVATTQNRLVLPTYAELTLTGHAPDVDISGHLALEPLPAALVLTGHVPSVEIHSTTPLPELIYGFAIVAVGDTAGVGTRSGGATVRSVEGGSTAVSTSGPSARVTIR